MTAGRAASPVVHFCYRGLGLPDWTEVIDAHAVPEPCRPLSVRSTLRPARVAYIDTMVGFGPAGYAFLHDYAGRRIFVARSLLHAKIHLANHAAYAGWIAATLAAPLEVWERPDTGPTTSDALQDRLHYFAAYEGPSGATSHLVLAVANDWRGRGPKLVNAFSLTAIANANEKRYGALQHLGYDPATTPGIAKGAVPRLSVAPLP